MQFRLMTDYSVGDDKVRLRIDMLNNGHKSIVIDVETAPEFPNQFNNGVITFDVDADKLIDAIQKLKLAK
jgi:hypothetical protein